MADLQMKLFEEIRHSVEDLAYAAGIIDGEGYIGITVLEKDKRRSGRSPAFQLVVNVGMADPEVVFWLREQFAGNVHSYAPGKYGTKRGVHHWRLTGRRAAAFCSLIRPYLKLKFGQADLALAYYRDDRLDHNGRGGPGYRLTDAEIQVRRDYKARIQSLNRREKSEVIA